MTADDCTPTFSRIPVDRSPVVSDLGDGGVARARGDGYSRQEAQARRAAHQGDCPLDCPDGLSGLAVMGSACKCSSQRRHHPMCLPGLCMQVLTTAPPPPHVPPRASRSGPMLGTWVGGAPNSGRDLVHACMRARASRCCGTRARARRAERPGRPDSLPRTFGFDRWSVCGRVHKAASILLIHSHLPDLHPLPSQGTLSSTPRCPFTPTKGGTLPS